jgi:protein ImuB
MLYLCLSLPALPLEIRQPAPHELVAVVDRHGSRRWLIACNAASQEAGLRPGLAATTALALRPDLRLIERCRSEERESLKSLAAWAEQFGSWVCFDAPRLLLWIEIGSGLRYFGGVDAMRSRIESGLAQLGYTALGGIAPTLEAAAALCAVDEAPIVDRRDDLVKILRPQSLDALAIDEDTAEALSGLGLNTIGGVLDLPRDALGRRFGLDLVDYLDRLVGAAADPREPFRSASKYRRRFEFLGSVASTEGLQFPLRRLFNELQGYLVARDTALQTVQIELGHDGVPPTCLEIRTTRPLRDAVRLFALARERLERTTLATPVEEIVLRADNFVPLGDTQLELIDGGQRRDEGWVGLLDKLRARLGDSAVRQLGLRDDHRPEHAWCIAAGQAAAPDKPFPERPLWLLEPRPLRTLPRRLGHPERIEAGWWDGRDESRDYYIARTEDGAQLWLYRNAAQGDWYVHGLWG